MRADQVGQPTRRRMLLDNIGAGFGRMPDTALRARMINYLETN
jgi:hypothetical protein